MLSPGLPFGELAPKLDSTYIPHRLLASVFSDRAQGTESEEGTSMAVSTNLK